MHYKADLFEMYISQNTLLLLKENRNDLEKNPYCITIHRCHAADYLVYAIKLMISMSTFNKNITLIATQLSTQYFAVQFNAVLERTQAKIW